MSFFNIQAFFKKARTEPNDENSIPKPSDQDLPPASKRKRQLENFIQSSEEQEKVIEKLQEEKSKWIEDKAKLEAEFQEEKNKWIEDKAKLEEELQR